MEIYDEFDAHFDSLKWHIENKSDEETIEYFRNRVQEILNQIHEKI